MLVHLTRRWTRGTLLSAAGGMGLLCAAANGAHAQGKLEAHYRVSLGGLPIGSGAWVIDLADDHYTMAASGQATGVMKAFSSGDGAAAVRGNIAGVKLAPSTYAINVRTSSRLDQVRIALAGGAVKDLSVEPPVQPDSKRVPLTEGHKRGVIDPVSAGMVPSAGANGLGPEACNRTLPIFDGRQRFDLALSYKRMDRSQAEKGYDGPVVVCAVKYVPVGGYEPDKAATRFLRDSDEMEMWFAPIAGTRFLAMYRITIPTLIGPAVLEANRFVTTAKTSRSGSIKTQ